MSIVQKRYKGNSFSQVNALPETKQIRKRSHSSPEKQTPEYHQNPSSKKSIFLNQTWLKKLSQEVFSDSYRHSERTAVTSRHCSKSDHLLSHSSSCKMNPNSLFTQFSGIPGCRVSLDQQLQWTESEEFEKKNLLNINEEPESSETNSMTSLFIKLRQDSRIISANSQIQTKVNALRSLFFNQTLSSEPPKQNLEESCKSQVPKDSGGQNLGDNLVKSLTFAETQQKYEKLKQIILSTSERLLQRKSICQKSPIFLSDEERTQRDQDQFVNKLPWNTVNNLNQFSGDQNKEFVNQSQLRGNQNKETMSITDKDSVSNYDNMVYHIFSKPQSSLKESLHKFNSSSLVTQQILYKKVYGFLDRFKKKIVSLYPDKLCYQESKSSPLSTISFRHYDISISKENQSKIFTLSIESLQKRFSFRCSDEIQKQFWVSTIADIIILNQSSKKFKLKPKYASIYSKKQVCSLNEAFSALDTGDLVIYQLTEKQKTNNLNLAVIIKTKFLLQVCYYSQEEGILTYPLESFLMLFEFANVSYRTLIANNQRFTSEQLIEDCITFINKNNQLNKYKDANAFIHSLLCEVGILKSNSPSNITKKKETIRTARLNLFTTKECQFSEEMYLLLPQHVESVININNHWQLHSLISDQDMKNNQMQLKTMECLESPSSQNNKKCLLRHQSLIPISYRNSSLPFTHLQGALNFPYQQIHSSYADYWIHNPELSQSFLEQFSHQKSILQDISDEQNNPSHPSQAETESQAQNQLFQSPNSNSPIQQINNSQKYECLNNQTISQFFQSPTYPTFHPQYNYIQLGKDYYQDETPKQTLRADY